MISWDFLRLTAPAAMPGHLGAVSLKKSHGIVILLFCDIVKGQAKQVYLGIFWYCKSYSYIEWYIFPHTCWKLHFNIIAARYLLIYFLYHFQGKHWICVNIQQSSTNPSLLIYFIFRVVALLLGGGIEV